MPFDRTRSVISLPRPAPGASALDLLGPVDGLHVLVIGPGSLEAMLALHRRGAAQVMSVSAACRLRMEKADAAFVPCLGSAEMARSVIAAARRAIRPLNSLVIVVPADAPASLPAYVRQVLAEYGFSTGRPVLVGGATALVADMPLYGQLKVA